MRECHSLTARRTATFGDHIVASYRVYMRISVVTHVQENLTTRSVLLNDTFGFVNSTKPERCVWRSAEGSFFDERSLLRAERRFAAVKATSRLSTMSISKPHFEKHFGPLALLVPDVYAKDVYAEGAARPGSAAAALARARTVKLADGAQIELSPAL